AALDPGDTATDDSGFELVVLPNSHTGDLLQLELAVTDDDGNAWTVTGPLLAIGMAQALVDGDDLADPFDVAGLLWAEDGGELTLMVTSHDAHDADQMTTVYLDADLDGAFEFALSTLDQAAGTYDGGLYVWDDLAGEYVQDTLSSFDFAAGSQFALMGAAMADLGDPVLLRAFVMTYDVSGLNIDYAPDDPSIDGDLGVLGLDNVPFILLDDSALFEQTGNGDDFVDPGELWELELAVLNAGLFDAAAVTGLLSYSGPEAAVFGGSLDFGSLAAGDSAWGLAPAVIEIDAGAPATGSLVFRTRSSANRFRSWQSAITWQRTTFRKRETPTWSNQSTFR
ncbi:MAG: hypothetical protein QGH45_12830, partial [Myxococcota bacterium]|nr:hypothetical protein [Myxococcota bacterium]